MDDRQLEQFKVWFDELTAEVINIQSELIATQRGIRRIHVSLWILLLGIPVFGTRIPERHDFNARPWRPTPFIDNHQLPFEISR